MLMKRTLIIFAMLFAVMAVNAQRRGFVCTANNVLVRKSASQNAQAITSYGERVKISKGAVVDNLGKKKNGFCYIRVHCIGIDMERTTGWVPAKYLRAVTICPSCEAYEGFWDCSRCRGKGYL